MPYTGLLVGRGTPYFHFDIPSRDCTDQPGSDPSTGTTSNDKSYASHTRTIPHGANLLPHYKLRKRHVYKKEKVTMQSTLHLFFISYPLISANQRMSSNLPHPCRKERKGTHQPPPATPTPLLRQPTTPPPSSSSFLTPYTSSQDPHTLFVPCAEHKLLFPPVMGFYFCVHGLNPRAR